MNNIPATFCSVDPQLSLWLTTWERIDKFLPELKGELFPPLPAEQTSTENIDAGDEVLRKAIKSESVVTGTTFMFPCHDVMFQSYFLYSKVGELGFQAFI